MSGPIRRLRAATKVPSPKATVQAVVANDNQHQVKAVLLEFAVTMVAPKALESTVCAELVEHNKANAESIFIAEVEFEACPQGHTYPVVASLLDADGKALAEKSKMTVMFEDYQQLRLLVKAVKSDAVKVTKVAKLKSKKSKKSKK